MGVAKKRKLNIQALARRDAGFMSCMLPNEEHTLISVDLSAGEPTISAHFSKDKNYRYATLDGVGQAPHYQGGLLMIDDIYLMAMSKSPMGKSRLREAFDTLYDGKTFAEKWLENSEFFTKGVLKYERELHKILVLGLGYGMGAKKMVKTAYEKGYSISVAQCKEFKNVYWSIFPGLRRFASLLEARFEREGYLVNPFGYRLVPDKPYKALNYFIQSSVNGVMALLVAKFAAAAPWAKFKSIVHDESIYDVPSDRVDEAKQLIQKAIDSLNADLKWSVQVRVGFTVAPTWFIK